MPAIQYCGEDAPEAKMTAKKEAPKSKPIDRLFSTSEPEEVEKWREKYGSKFLSDAAKALEGMPSYEKFKVADAPKISDLEGKKKSPKKEAPKANNGSEEFHIVFLDEDGVEYEVPEDSALELIALMCMLDE